MAQDLTVLDGKVSPERVVLKLPDISSLGNPKIAIAEPLPAGTNAIGSVTANLGTLGNAATAANQASGNTLLASLDSKFPVLGQALAAASIPVVLPAAQITALTPPSTIASTQSGTWTVQPGNTPNTTPWLFRLGDGTNTLALLNLTNSKPIPTAIVDANGTQITNFGGTASSYTNTNRSGTTHATANTWTQVAASNTSRREISIQNPPANAFNLQIGIGAGGSETVVFELEPGNAWARGWSDRISIRCVSAASQTFYASEG